MWPLTIHKVLVSKVVKLERVISSFVKKWLSLPRCMSNIGLYENGILDLPVYKCSQLRLEIKLMESLDPCRLSQPLGTETLLDMCSKGVVASALDIVDYFGTRQLYLSGKNLLLALAGAPP